MEKHKEVFFVIRLHSTQSAASLPPINDPDASLNCDLMDGRDAFLTLAREKHYEFSTLRRAKYSSMALLYELHNSKLTNSISYLKSYNIFNPQAIVALYTLVTNVNGMSLIPDIIVQSATTLISASAVIVQKDIIIEWKDSASANLSVVLEKTAPLLVSFRNLFSGIPLICILIFATLFLGGAVAGGSGDIGNNGDGSGGSTITSPGESRRLSIQRCIQSLVHACQCRDANCRLPSCHKMKKVVQHAKTCKKRGNTQALANQQTGCPICKQLIALCCYHAKHCNEQKCPVPYCPNIKHRLKAQQLHQKLQQQQILKRRIATMTSQPTSSSQQHDYSSSNQQPVSFYKNKFFMKKNHY